MKTLAFSSCPNDTFIFHALVHSLININGLSFSTHIDDVESLNHAALNQEYDITKLSFHGFLHVQDNYELLDAGAALGFGCGPLVITRKGLNNIQHAVIATPGIYTTAHLLFRLRFGNSNEFVHVRFDEILPGIQQGIFDATGIRGLMLYHFEAYSFLLCLRLGHHFTFINMLAQSIKMPLMHIGNVLIHSFALRISGLVCCILKLLHMLFLNVQMIRKVH